MSTSEDDDGGRLGLDGIMEAAILDDLGGCSVFLDRIVEYYRSWHYCRNDHRHMGRVPDLRSIEMAGQEIRQQVVMPTLSGTQE